MKHELTYKAQPIADQIMFICSCGWRKPVCFLDYISKPEKVWEEGKRLHAVHAISELGKEYDIEIL